MEQATGAVMNTREYDAFGSVRSSAGTQANPFTFTGERSDASTGLEYLRARYYDQTTGAFISRDRYPGTTVRPLTQDRFSYALGNPILNTDPSGMCVADSVYEKIEHLRNPFRGGTPGYDTFEKIREMSLAAITKFCGNLEALKNAAKKFPDMAKHFADDIGSAAKKIKRFLKSDCGSFALGLVELGLSFGGPSSQLTALGITTAYSVYDTVHRNGLNIAVDLQASYGNIGGIVHKMPGGVRTNLGSLSVTTSIVSSVYYGAKCAGI